MKNPYSIGNQIYLRAPERRPRWELARMVE